MTCAPRQMQSVGNAGALRGSAGASIFERASRSGRRRSRARRGPRRTARGRCRHRRPAGGRRTDPAARRVPPPSPGDEDRGPRSGSAERIEVRRRHAVSTLGPAGDAARFQAIRGDGDQGRSVMRDVGASLPQNRASSLIRQWKTLRRLRWSPRFSDTRASARHGQPASCAHRAPLTVGSPGSGSSRFVEQTHLTPGDARSASASVYSQRAPRSRSRDGRVEQGEGARTGPRPHRPGLAASSSPRR